MTLFLVVAWILGLGAQDAAGARVRFAEPAMDPMSGLYSVQVEASGERGVLLGMNLRFFFDASILQFRRMDRLAQGYGLVREAPAVHVGSSGSGPELFGFRGHAAYFNGSFELKDEAFRIELRPGTWVPVCRLEFAPVKDEYRDKDFCPPLVWDLLTDGTGLLGGEGLVIAIRPMDGGEARVLAGRAIRAASANWQPARTADGPWGLTASNMCLNINPKESLLASAPDQEERLVVLPNEPNPWSDRTALRFLLGVDSDVSVRLFTPDGKLVFRTTGSYPAGMNRLEIRRPPGTEGLGWLSCQWIGPDGKTWVSTLSLVD